MNEQAETERWQQVSEEVGFPLEAIHFLYEAMEFVPHYNGQEPRDVEAIADHCSAAELCNAFQQYSSDCFGVDCRTQLESWGINSSEDQGVLVWALVARGLIDCEACEKQNDFSGHF